MSKKRVRAKGAPGVRHLAAKTLGAGQARRVRGGAAETPTERAARLAWSSQAGGNFSAKINVKSTTR